MSLVVAVVRDMLDDDSFMSGDSLGSSMDLATTPDSPLSRTSKVGLYTLA